MNEHETSEKDECDCSTKTFKVISHFNSCRIVKQISSHINNESSRAYLTKEFHFQRTHRTLNKGLSLFTEARDLDIQPVSYINSCHLLFIVMLHVLPTHESNAEARNIRSEGRFTFPTAHCLEQTEINVVIAGNMCFHSIIKINLLLSVCGLA